MRDPVVHPYIPNSAPAAREAMLRAVGAASTAEFFVDVPEELRLAAPLDLPPAILAEEDLRKHVNGILAHNDASRLMFLGRGTYAHGTPAVVAEVINRGEFLTAYAGEPYEDHGRFQALFEYESLMGELLACDVVTVPTYDGFQATATAVAIANRVTGRARVLVVSDVLPDKLSRVADFVKSFVELEFVPTRDGIADVAAVHQRMSADVACVWVETPSATGAVETALADIAEIAHEAGALLVVGTDPLMAGIIEPPAVMGADITCGDIQSLGLGQWYGGAHAGFLAMADDPTLVMELPSRLFGIAATDVSGEYGFGDVAYDRTSFAHREDGKEWVGTAAALWGIAAAVYLSLMGPQGMREVGETVLLRTKYLQQRIAALPGFRLVDQALHFREFTVQTERPAADIVALARAHGVEPGVVLDDHTLCICVTEQHSASDLDRLISVLTDTKENR